MVRMLLVALGGALGSGARYALCSLAQARLGSNLPVGTLLVNVVGSFLICLIAGLGAANVLSASTRLFLTTGILGGFTTYSAFDLEVFRFAQDGRYLSALLYIVATVVLCFVAGAGGDAVGRMLIRT